MSISHIILKSYFVVVVLVFIICSIKHSNRNSQVELHFILNLNFIVVTFFSLVKRTTLMKIKRKQKFDEGYFVLFSSLNKKIL